MTSGFSFPLKMRIVKLSGTWAEIAHPCPAETARLDQLQLMNYGILISEARGKTSRWPSARSEGKCLPPQYPRKQPVSSDECFPRRSSFLEQVAETQRPWNPEKVNVSDANQ